MKSFLINILTVLLVVWTGFTGCEVIFNHHDNPDGLLKDTYYGSEIFDESNLDIYGRWQLYAVSGGIHGGGHELNFDLLEMKAYGIYKFIQEDNILEYGRIRIDEQTEEGLQITFEPDSASDTFMYDAEKYVFFYSTDTLFLQSPCCDRFNYHFVRVK